MIAAVGEALDRIERQAIKHRTRWRSIKQKARKKQPASAAEVAGRGISAWRWAPALPPRFR